DRDRDEPLLVAMGEAREHQEELFNNAIHDGVSGSLNAAQGTSMTNWETFSSVRRSLPSCMPMVIRSSRGRRAGSTPGPHAAAYCQSSVPAVRGARSTVGPALLHSATGSKNSNGITVPVR